MRKKLTAKTFESLPAAQGGRYEVWDLALPSFGIRVARTDERRGCDVPHRREAQAAQDMRTKDDVRATH
jgi:hypothetical protein